MWLCGRCPHKSSGCHSHGPRGEWYPWVVLKTPALGGVTKPVGSKYGCVDSREAEGRKEGERKGKSRYLCLITVSTPPVYGLRTWCFPGPPSRHCSMPSCSHASSLSPSLPAAWCPSSQWPSNPPPISWSWPCAHGK